MSIQTIRSFVYKATLSDSQRVMRWHLLLEEFGSHIRHIAGVDNIVANTLSCVKSSNVEEDKNEPSEKQMLQELYVAIKIQSIQADFPLEKGLIHNEQQKELKNKNSLLKTLIDNKDSGYTINDIDNVSLGLGLVLKDDNIYIYIPESMRETTLNWYHHYLNHPGGNKLGNTIKQNYYWKGLSNQAKQFVKRCKICQQHKRKRKYGHVPAKTIEDHAP